MKIPLMKKTILITGASSGIGEATARACVNADRYNRHLIRLAFALRSSSILF